MKKKLSHAVLLTGIILFCLILFSYAYWNGGTIEDTVKVSVVLDSQNSQQWEVLRQGMESFAKENEIEVSYVILTGVESIKEQMEILHREVQNGAEGIVLNLPNKGALVKQINETLSQTRIVMVDSSLPLTFDCGYIAPDNAAMGKKLAETVLSEAREEENFGIMIGNSDMQSNQERLQGVKEILGDRIAFVASTPDGVSKELWQKTERLLFLDVQAGEAAVDKGKEDGKLLYGIGRTEKLVYYLDKGIVDTLLVTDDFVMGYTALQSLYRQLRYYAAIEKETIPYILVNRENLYTGENERILFPVVQ